MNRLLIPLLLVGYPKEILLSEAMSSIYLLRTDFTSWDIDTFGADLLSPSESFPSTAVFEFTSL